MMRQALKRLRFLLNARERIAGIAFTDSTLYCTLATDDDSAGSTHMVTHALPERIISGGIVLDHEMLTKEISATLVRFGTQVSFANLSLPSSLIFSTILHLPKSELENERFKKTLELLLPVELPWKPEEAYTNYHIEEGATDLVVSVFSLLRSSADPYILAAEHAGLEVLALEFDTQSTARVLVPQESNRLFVTATETHASICVMKSNTVRFAFTLPIEKIPNETVLRDEISHIQNFFTTETGETIAAGLAQLAPNAQAAKFLGAEASRVPVFPAAGAALFKPSSTANEHGSSLLPLRPDELYTLHRLASGLQLLREATFVTCLVLIGAHFLLLQTLNSVAKQSAERATSAPQLYAHITEITKETTALTESIAAADAIGAHVKRYSAALDLIDHIASEGITINAITAGESQGPITISGTAATRNQYNYFRTSIVAADKLEVTSFPLGSLDAETNIPFTLTVKAKNT